MPIYLGSNEISPYKGSAEIGEAYLGNTLVYQSLPKYVENGLMLMLDASHNTSSGFDKTATTWADLSGNSNNFSITGANGDVFFDGTVKPNLLKSTDTQSSIGQTIPEDDSEWWLGAGGNGTCSVVDYTGDAPHHIKYGFNIAGNTSGNMDLRQKAIGKMASGSQYSRHCYVRGSGTVQFRIWDATANSARYSTTKAINTSSWQHIYFTFSATRNMANANRQIYCYFGLVNTASIEFCGMKLEQSWYPTRWIPNEADSDYVGGYVDSNVLNKEVRYLNPYDGGTSTKVIRNGYNPWTWSTGFTFEWVIRPTSGAISMFTTKPFNSNREAWLTSALTQFGIHLDGSGTYNTDGASENGKFTTITMTRGSASSATGSASLNVYVNGKWMNNWSTGSVNISPTGFYLFSRDANEQQLNGRGYAVRIYNRSLNREEIAFNSQLDRIHYDTTYPFTNKKAGLKSLNVLELIDHEAKQANAVFTQNADGTWTKDSTDPNLTSAQGCIWAEIDVTDYRFINYKMQVTRDSGNDAYRTEGFCTQANIDGGTHSPTHYINMGRSVGNRWGTIDVSALSGVWKVGIQTGCQLGTITNITAWA